MKVLSCCVLIGGLWLVGQTGARCEAVADGEDLYHDLRVDSYADRVLDTWYSLIGFGEPMELPSRVAANEWMQEQDGSAFPVLIEVFRRDERLRVKRRVLAYFTTNPGDKGEMLLEVRKALPSWFEELPSEDPSTGFIYSALSFLSNCGGEEDRLILRELADSRRQGWSELADRELQFLDRRLTDAGRRPNRSTHSETLTGRATDGRSLEPSRAEDPAEPRTGPVWWIVVVAAGALLVGVVRLLWMRKHRHQRT